ncbi:MAG: protein translocase subunit SecF [Patescibacteria group bacterium]
MKINWMKFTWLYFLISLLVLIPGIASLLVWGLVPSLDFTGGTVLEVKGESGIGQLEVNQAASDLGLDLGNQQLSEEDKNKLLVVLSQKDPTLELVRFETLGPSLGRELLIKTGLAIILATLAILLYLTFQFKQKVFGIAAIMAMLHDTFILLGSFSLLGHFFQVKVDGLFVTALLTILSFSVHDTVVVFDRIRELSRINPKESLKNIANSAVSQTLVRSVNNSLTIIFMLTALVILGGESTRWFATALLIGTITGTYSSTFTAVPLLLVFEKVFRKKK